MRFQGITKLGLTVGLITPAVIVVLASFFVLSNLVRPRWESSGVPVGFKIAVVDAQTGKPVAGAKVLVWLFADEHWHISESRADDTSATTDANGTCEIGSYFPGSGIGGKGRLRVNTVIWIRANGYESWQKPSTAFLGNHITVRHPFSQTNWYPLKVFMTPKAGT